MKNTFSTASRRRVIDANYNSYQVPTLHPTRKMNMHDLLYILNGEWMIGQEKEIFTVEKDDVLILAAGLHHYGISLCSQGTKTMYIHVSRESGDAQGENAGGLIVTNHLNTAGNPEIRRLFEKIIIARMENDETKASVYVDALLYELEELSSREKGRDLAGDIRKEIVASSGRLLKNSQIAAMFHVSVKTAENTFKSVYHMTIHQYMLKTKIEQAQTYLIDFPEMKHFEIAKNLGFYDEYHFSRQFKRICGISPSEYRRCHAGYEKSLEYPRGGRPVPGKWEKEEE